MFFILIFSLLLFYFTAYAAFFFNRPSRTAEITVPTTNATRYITAFPTTGNTKIPPCGAISVQSNAMEIAPATADPMIQDGSTRRGSDAANGIAPYVINARPMIKLVGPASLSSFVNLSLNSSVASAIAQGGVMPPIITAAIIS